MNSDHCPPVLFQEVCFQSADCYSSALAPQKCQVGSALLCAGQFQHVKHNPLPKP